MQITHSSHPDMTLGVARSNTNNQLTNLIYSYLLGLPMRRLIFTHSTLRSLRAFSCGNDSRIQSQKSLSPSNKGLSKYTVLVNVQMVLRTFSMVIAVTIHSDLSSSIKLISVWPVKCHLCDGWFARWPNRSSTGLVLGVCGFESMVESNQWLIKLIFVAS